MLVIKKTRNKEWEASGLETPNATRIRTDFGLKSVAVPQNLKNVLLDELPILILKYPREID